MLVLSRHREESVHLSDSIVVQVLAIKGDRVRLGFTAPREVQIVRSELLRKSPGQLNSCDDAGRNGSKEKSVAGRAELVRARPETS